MISSHNDPDLYKTQTIHVFISYTSTTSSYSSFKNEICF